MRRKAVAGVWILAFVLAMMAFACGGSDSKSATKPAGSVGETASKAVTAASGGSVALDSQAASVAIPAGALSADATITIGTKAASDTPDAASLGSYVFDFGPDGTTFTAPVALALKLDVTVPSGKKAVLVWLENGAWSVVAGSVAAGGYVTGSVSHFSRYAIRFDSDGTVVETEDAVCKDLNFSACGGDPIGTWAVEAYCLQTRPISDEGSMFEEIPVCKENGNSAIVLDITYTGSVVLNADYTFERTLGTIVASEMTMKDACLDGIIAKYGQQAAGMSRKDVCNSLAQSMKGSCSYAGGVCSCEMGRQENPGQTLTGVWAKDGTNLKFADTTANLEGTDDVLPYCVSGSQVVLEFTVTEDTNDDDVDDVTYLDHLVLKKQ